MTNTNSPVNIILRDHFTALSNAFNAVCGLVALYLIYRIFSGSALRHLRDFIAELDDLANRRRTPRALNAIFALIIIAAFAVLLGMAEVNEYFGRLVFGEAGANSVTMTAIFLTFLVLYGLFSLASILISSGRR